MDARLPLFCEAEVGRLPYSLAGESCILLMPADKISPTSANLSSAVMVLGSGRPGAHLTLGGGAG